MRIDIYGNEEKRDFIILLISFILFPFFSLFFIFRKIYDGKYYALIFLAVFMGLLSMFYFPFGDQYRYYEWLKEYAYQSFDEIIDFNSVLIYRDLNIITLLVFFASKIGLTLELLRFILTTICYLLIFSVYRGILITNINILSKSTLWTLFLIYFLSMPFYFICFGLRTGVGICFFIYGLYNVINANRCRGYLGLLIASFCHAVFFLYLVIVVVVRFAKFSVSRQWLLLISCAIPLFSWTLLSYLYGNVDFFDAIMDSYIYGKWGGEYDWSFVNVRKRLFLGGMAMAYIYVIFFLRQERNFLYNFLSVNFSLCILFLPFGTFLERIVAISLPLLTLYILIYRGQSLSLFTKRLMLLLMMITFLTPFWIHRYPYRQAHIEKILYEPLPLILQNTYTSNEIYSHVNRDGEFVIR